MIEITERPLSKEDYLKALDNGWTLWTNYRTGEVFIQRQFWRRLTSEQKAIIVRLIDGEYNNNDSLK
ncbi:MAG TPA: hypothetical protein VGE97_02815 [Nitrososphaera sp.]|jgi:hypothetical protein